MNGYMYYLVTQNVFVCLFGTFRSMVINLKFSPVLSKSMYKFLMLLLYFFSVSDKMSYCKNEHMRANLSYFFFHSHNGEIEIGKIVVAKYFKCATQFFHLVITITSHLMHNDYNDGARISITVII